ncbi:MAG: ArsR/SmtB family transcription factor [Acidimicrobiales bacterium]
MDDVFRALDDQSRRTLLDSLFDDDGQTLTELCAQLPTMTRHGVMNHLRVLERAGLVTTTRMGKAKHHYLNPVPIRLVRDRWINRYADAQVDRLVDVQARAEKGSDMRQQERPVHRYQVVVKASPEEVWLAIVDGDQTAQYFFKTRVASTWEVGAPVTYTLPDGTVAADGEILAIDPGHRVEYTFQARWDPELAADGPAREAWIVEPADGVTKLTVEVYDLAPDSKTLGDFIEGLPEILSGMKTLLETGAPLRV